MGGGKKERDDHGSHRDPRANNFGGKYCRWDMVRRQTRSAGISGHLSSQTHDSSLLTLH